MARNKLLFLGILVVLLGLGAYCLTHSFVIEDTQRTKIIEVNPN